MMILRIAFLILVISLTACAPVHAPECLDKLPLAIPDAPVVNLWGVKFRVVIEPAMTETFNEAQRLTGARVVFVLTGDEYKKLSLDIGKMLEYMYAQNQTLRAYRRYYEPQKASP